MERQVFACKVKTYSASQASLGMAFDKVGIATEKAEFLVYSSLAGPQHPRY